jgi:HK97 family phage major capsid protein
MSTSLADRFTDHKTAASQRWDSTDATDHERKLREEWGAMIDQYDAIGAKAKKEGRDLNGVETHDAIGLSRRIEAIRADIDAIAAPRNSARARINPQMADEDALQPHRQRVEWRDSEGRPVHVLAKTDRWTDLPKSKDYGDLGLGDMVRCAITGKGPKEIKAAMGENANSTGGFLVPDELAGRVIDLARAKAVVMQAGAQTAVMNSDRLTMARVSADPTFEIHAENAQFSTSTVGFDGISFTAFTVGQVILASRELAEDAPNFMQLVEDTLAKAWAAKIDNIAINGSGNFNGILNWPTTGGFPIGETASVGTLAWSAMATAATGIRLTNHEPTAYVINPTPYNTLATSTTGDGVNASKNWLPPPPTVATLAPLQTTNIGTGSVVLGQFDQFVFAIRKGVQVEITTTGGPTFQSHQAGIKLTWRGDCNAFRRDAFWRLTGIS